MDTWQCLVAICVSYVLPTRSSPSGSPFVPAFEHLKPLERISGTKREKAENGDRGSVELETLVLEKVEEISSAICAVDSLVVRILPVG
ncbi:hypothetical protein MUK42_36100 [Musa troglodytarum]|uniref:Uncharacterized protein n=1 Tax=Musa troglodytarum TaxID=320322 RepID=A0A9E7EAB0_9LILI|nr:hypothetical protein MUK42_36100 [Musa troglodytarum]